MCVMPNLARSFLHQKAHACGTHVLSVKAHAFHHDGLLHRLQIQLNITTIQV